MYTELEIPVLMLEGKVLVKLLLQGLLVIFSYNTYVEKIKLFNLSCWFELKKWNLTGKVKDSKPQFTGKLWENLSNSTIKISGCF